MLVILLLVIIYWPTLHSQEKFETNARRLFKLASENVDDTSAGFTQRPYAAGKVDSFKNDIAGFARFLTGRYIAKVVHSNESTYFLFSMNTSVLKTNDPDDVSYVELNKDGKLVVRISQSDYHQYKSKFNFDQLCAQMADVFIRFLNYYNNGNEERIITELKTIR